MPADFFSLISVSCEQAFKEWCSNIDAELTVKKITVQSVDMFGPRVGFVKFKGDVTDDSGRNIPAIVFMRGASVGMLVVITCVDDGQKYTVLTVQSRVPSGKFALKELPAGMLDDSGNFAGVAAKELEEECSLKVQEKDLIDLTEKAFKDTGFSHAYTTPGGSDEVMRLFLYEVMKSLDRGSWKRIEEMRGSALVGLLALSAGF